MNRAKFFITHPAPPTPLWEAVDGLFFLYSLKFNSAYGV